MGRSWRVGVDKDERTDLVTEGPFAFVRNPIYSAMLPTVLGLALMVPSWVAFAGLASLFAALELQVRVVEEPYLLHVHGDRYGGYAAHVGASCPASVACASSSSWNIRPVRLAGRRTGAILAPGQGIQGGKRWRARALTLSRPNGR